MLVIHLTGTNAFAVSDKEPLAAGETMTFSVIGELPQGQFGISTLQKVGVTDDELARMERGVVRTSPSEVAKLVDDPNDPYQVMATWSDNRGTALSMRWGSSSWGWLKVSNKHNLTTAAARTTTKHPETRVVESASAIRYRTPVHRVECNFGVCQVVETKTVRVIANPIRLSDGKAKGVITAYCEGVVWCPSWVKNAINT